MNQCLAEQSLMDWIRANVTVVLTAESLAADAS